jgi:hypothetical protein
VSKDDFEVVAYKVLSYLYACLKAGAEPSDSYARQVSGVNDVYYCAVVRSLMSKGLVEPFGEIRDIGGDVLTFAGTPSLTMDGAAYLRDDAAMRRVASHVSVHDEVQEAVRATVAM